ncbi:pilus assembly protein [Lichenibacterium minor]|uniref:Pilus assembly protein n=1 Tax=Lichenibacterium minor TaxID=2316528 RepID=A0A4Q2U827_9HYPH|nr:TadE/TadG family type IV pilus assembly protein [Lichenibacterium minor]RYC31197.1 pilus assembly protein [Lichenibacterium minor]
MPHHIPRWILDRRGATAVEFALVMPILVMLLFGIVAFGAVIGVDNGIQQLVAEAARASVAGLSDPERAQLAQAFVSANAASYPFIDPTRIALSTSDPTATSFQVTVRYDMSGLFAYRMLSGLPLPSPAVARSAVVQRGGF